jgi:hypothetical protein
MGSWNYAIVGKRTRKGILYTIREIHHDEDDKGEEHTNYTVWGVTKHIGSTPEEIIDDVRSRVDNKEPIRSGTTLDDPYLASENRMILEDIMRHYVFMEEDLDNMKKYTVPDKTLCTGGPIHYSIKT